MSSISEKKPTANAGLKGNYKRLESHSPIIHSEFIVAGKKHLIKIRKEENVTVKKGKYMLYVLNPAPETKSGYRYRWISSVYGVDEDPLKCRFDYKGIFYLMAITPDHIEIKLDAEKNEIQEKSKNE